MLNIKKRDSLFYKSTLGGVKMIKAVIFDLDGTLLNRDASVKRFIEKQYDRLHKRLGHVSKESYVSRFIELDCRGYVWKDIVYQQLVSEFNISEITWEKLLQDYVDCFKNDCVPFENLDFMIMKLKNQSIKLGMITNGRGQFQMDNIKALGIEAYLDVILISEWESLKKPDPELFKRALNKLKITPEKSAFVGDHPETDILGAQSVGMYTIWKKDSEWDDVEADFTIDNLEELPFIIESMNQSLD